MQKAFWKSATTSKNELVWLDILTWQWTVSSWHSNMSFLNFVVLWLSGSGNKIRNRNVLKQRALFATTLSYVAFMSLQWLSWTLSLEEVRGESLSLFKSICNCCNDLLSHGPMFVKLLQFIEMFVSVLIELTVSWPL